MAETGFTGVGIRVARTRDGNQPPYVTEVFRDSPAAAAGVKAGRSDQGCRWPDDRRPEPDRGRHGDSWRPGLEGRAVGGTRQRRQPDVDITRRTVDAPRVEGADSGRRARGAADSLLRATACRSRCSSFLTQGRNRGAKAWIVDLRGNPGGSLEAMARVAANFIEARPVGLAVDRNGQSDPITARAPAIPRFPFVVLVDRETAAGGGVLAAAIKESGAPIVGGAQREASGMATPQPLSDGSAIQVTIRGWWRPRARSSTSRASSRISKLI